MKISQKLVKNLKRNNVRLRASLLLYKVLLLEFFARNVWALITYEKRLALGTNNQSDLFLSYDKGTHPKTLQGSSFDMCDIDGDDPDW